MRLMWSSWEGQVVSSLNEEETFENPSQDGPSAPCLLPGTRVDLDFIWILTPSVGLNSISHCNPSLRLLEEQQLQGIPDVLILCFLTALCFPRLKFLHFLEEKK